MQVKIMPSCIRLSMACGIGLFLAFIGLKDMGIITGDNATLVTLNLPLSSINTDFQKIWMGARARGMGTTRGRPCAQRTLTLACPLPLLKELLSSL